MAKHWTPSDDDLLAKFWSIGASTDDIATYLSVAFDRDISEKSVFMRAKRSGLVARHWHKGRRFLGEHKGDADGPCLMWPFGKNNKGYGVTHDEVASRIMCELANGPPPTDGHEAAHSCGNGDLGCVHPKHLRWATHFENMQDMVLHGKNRRSNNGEASL